MEIAQLLPGPQNPFVQAEGVFHPEAGQKAAAVGLLLFPPHKPVVIAVDLPLGIEDHHRLLGGEQHLPAQLFIQCVQGVAEIFSALGLVIAFPQQSNKLLTGGAALHRQIIQQGLRPLEGQRHGLAVQQNPGRTQSLDREHKTIPPDFSKKSIPQLVPRRNRSCGRNKIVL